jgi:hypothetical protein
MKFWSLLLVSVILGGSTLHAQDLGSGQPIERTGNQGFGVMLGNPTGVSAKYWINEGIALDGAFGVARGEFDVHADLLFHLFHWSEEAVFLPKWVKDADYARELPFYFGMGPRLLFADDNEFGIRFPFGFSYLPHTQPWEVFFEVAPVVRTTPDFGFNGDIAIGARYYFAAIRPLVKRE